MQRELTIPIEIWDAVVSELEEKAIEYDSIATKCLIGNKIRGFNYGQGVKDGIDLALDKFRDLV